MSKLRIFFLGLALCTLSGCMNFVEEILVNRDGSGTYKLTFDLSAISNDPFSKSMFDQMIEQGGVFNRKEEEKILIDTTLYFRDMPVADRRKMGDADFWDKLMLNLEINEQDSITRLQLQLNFNELSDIDYFYQNIGKLGASMTDFSGIPLENLLSDFSFFNLKKKKLYRQGNPFEASKPAGESLEFAKAFFEESQFETIYHLPGKVKKTTLSEAKIEDNKVILTYPFLKLLEGELDLSGQIKFK